MAHSLIEGLDIMELSPARRSRQVASWASLACIAVLLTACNSPTPAATSASSASSVPSTSSASPAAGPTGASTFLAPSQSLNATLLHEPACDGFGCALSGDSTAFLFHTKWTTWSGTKAIGTGTYKLDGCNPDCAGGHVYSVPTVVTLSHPVKVCAGTSARWVWSRASFTFPHGLPKALQAENGPLNPWIFSGLITAAHQTCTS
jgi:hypothetical protein